MRKLIESTFVTLDGVIDQPQRWSPPYWDDEHHAYSSKLLFAAEALLLGRATYEGFASSWPKRSGDEFTDHINAMPKYVASRGQPAMTWNASLLEGDAVDAVRRLKESGDGGLLKYGTGELDRALFGAGLVDELHLWVFPVGGWDGERVFDDFEKTTLKLLGSTTFASGIVVLRYGPKE